MFWSTGNPGCAWVVYDFGAWHCVLGDSSDVVYPGLPVDQNTNPTPPNQGALEL